MLPPRTAQYSVTPVKAGARGQDGPAFAGKTITTDLHLCDLSCSRSRAASARSVDNG